MVIPLWRTLSKAARLPVNKRFAALDSAGLAALSLSDLALLAQWMLAHENIVTQAAAGRAGGIDLELENPARKQSEFARVFGGHVPVNALYDAFEHVQGRPSKKLLVFIPGAFTESQRGMEKDYALFLDLIDGQTWLARLKEIQVKDARFFTERRKAKRR